MVHSNLMSRASLTYHKVALHPEPYSFQSTRTLDLGPEVSQPHAVFGRTMWWPCTSSMRGGIMDTASWRVMLPPAFSRLISSWMACTALALELGELDTHGTHVA